MDTQAWLVILADADGGLTAIAWPLELMNAAVDLVQNDAETVTLIRRSKKAPNLRHILAEEFGGLERAQRYIKIYIGKAYLGNALFFQMTYQTYK